MCGGNVVAIPPTLSVRSMTIGACSLDDDDDGDDVSLVSVLLYASFVVAEGVFLC